MLGFALLGADLTQVDWRGTCWKMGEILVTIWGFPSSLEYPNSWMVYFTENPSKIWMI